MTSGTCLALLLAAHTATNAVSSEGSKQSSYRLLGDFHPGWAKQWMEKRLGQPNRYSVVEEHGDRVLKLESTDSASALWRMFSIHPIEEGTISWRWKVEKSLLENDEETTKKGDDYAARVFVIFGPGVFNRKARAICYVWAGNEAPGSVSRSPYSSSVATVVLESGDELSEEWVSERRDFVEDFRTIFGESPEMTTAVALMVDTDNTDSRAVAWFDDLVVTVESGSGRG